MPERFAEYLRQVGNQIRWKRAVPVLTEELKTHLLEQYEDCVANGKSEADAESETLRQMGDALTVGRELDSVHRPKPQWGCWRWSWRWRLPVVRCVWRLAGITRLRYSCSCASALPVSRRGTFWTTAFSVGTPGLSAHACCLRPLSHWLFYRF